MSKPNIYLRLELQLVGKSADEVVIRWKYGRELFMAMAVRKQLPHGFIDDRVAEADKAGIKASRRDIQYRVRLAEVYGTERQVRKIVCTLGSWTEIINAGFPAVESDDPEDLPDGVSAESADDWEQLSLIPGLGEELKVRGKTIALADATLGDVKAYRDMYAGIHANFAKRLALIENAVRIMEAAGAGEDDNALDAWRRGVSES